MNNNKLWGILFGLIATCLILGMLINTNKKSTKEASDKALQEERIDDLEARLGRMERFQLSIIAASQQYNEVEIEG